MSMSAFSSPTCALPSVSTISQTFKSLVIALAAQTQTVAGPSSIGDVASHLNGAALNNNLTTRSRTIKESTSSSSSSSLQRHQYRAANAAVSKTVIYRNAVAAKKRSGGEGVLQLIGRQRPIERDSNKPGRLLLVSNDATREKGKQENKIRGITLADARRRQVMEEGYEILKEQFVDECKVDWKTVHRRLQRRIDRVQTDDDMEQVLQWLYTRAGDPFTRYLSEGQLEAMKGDIDGQMCGVGIVFNAERYGLFLRDKRVIIRHVVPGSPADEAGLQCGDHITAIDMNKVSTMSFDEATTRLLGKMGRKVLLTFRRGKSNEMELSVLLERRKFQVPTVSAELVGDEVCYVQIREFASNTARQMRECLYRMMKEREQRQLESNNERSVFTDETMMLRGNGTGRKGLNNNSNKMKVLILDLRGNSGGLVDKAIEVARMFLDPEDTVVKFVGRDGMLSVETGRDSGWLWSFVRTIFGQSQSQSSQSPDSLMSVVPGWQRMWRGAHGGVKEMYETMVILVDSETASASELLASALRDNCKAVVVGTVTFGKGSVQAIVPLGHGGGAAVTVARYLTPCGTALVMGDGLRPDWMAFRMPHDARLVVERLFSGRGGPFSMVGIGGRRVGPDEVVQVNEKRIKWIKGKVERCMARKKTCMKR